MQRSTPYVVLPTSTLVRALYKDLDGFVEIDEYVLCIVKNFFAVIGDWDLAKNCLGAELDWLVDMGDSDIAVTDPEQIRAAIKKAFDGLYEVTVHLNAVEGNCFPYEFIGFDGKDVILEHHSRIKDAA